MFVDGLAEALLILLLVGISGVCGVLAAIVLGLDWLNKKKPHWRIWWWVVAGYIGLSIAILL